MRQSKRLTFSLLELVASFFIFYLSGIEADANGDVTHLTLSVSPSFTIRPGESVAFQCEIDTTVVSATNSIVWSRITGSLAVKIGVDNFITESVNFSSRDRYSIERTTKGTKLIYTLKIRAATLEDSGTIKCGVHNSDRESTLPLAVCDNPKAYSCECILKNYGWASPQCFEEPSDWRNDRASHNRSIVGLGVCLAIAVIFGIIMAIMVGRDCMHKMYEKRKKREEMQRKLRQNGVPSRRSAYDDSEVLQLDPNDASSTTGLRYSEMGHGEDATDSGKGSTDNGSPRSEERFRDQHVDQRKTYTNGGYTPDYSRTAEQGGVRSPAADAGGARPKDVTKADVSAASSRHPRTSEAPSGTRGTPPPRYVDDGPSYPYQGNPGQYQPESPQPQSDAYPAHQYSSPGAISSISYNDRPAYPHTDVPARGAYTDLPKEKKAGYGQYADHRPERSEPRRLDFQGGQSTPAPYAPNRSGPEIDSASTMI